MSHPCTETSKPQALDTGQGLLCLCTDGLNAGLWSQVGRTTVANPDFSGIRFLDLNVELLLELSLARLHYSTRCEASCVRGNGGDNSLIGGRVKGPAPPPSRLCMLHHRLLSWNVPLEMLLASLQAPCSCCLNVRMGRAVKQAQVINTVTALSAPVTDTLPWGWQKG